MNDARFNDYLDGRLSKDERADVERRIADDPELRATVAAQREVDAFLRRELAPDAGVAQRVLLAAGAVEESAAPRLAGSLRGMRYAAAAAVLIGLSVGLLALRPDGAAPEPIEIGEIGRSEQAPVSPAQVLPSASGLIPRLPADLVAAAAPTGPDLDHMFAAFDHGFGADSLGQGGSFQDSLERRYDECFDIESIDCALIGPFTHPEHPSATILLGFCEGESELSSMLVVDDETMSGCALTPRAADLQPFYKEVNGLAVWEVTRRDTPQLLDSVRPCGDG
ncbi:MAG: hypothetical protein AAF682_02360 [Planctomycetota bacterium]